MSKKQEMRELLKHGEGTTYTATDLARTLDWGRVSTTNEDMSAPCWNTTAVLRIARKLGLKIVTNVAGTTPVHCILLSLK
jgi:hypothetical protein